MTSKCSFNMWSSDRDDKAQSNHDIPFSLMASISRFFASSLSFPSGLLRVKRQAANSRLGFLGKPSSSRFSTGILTWNQKDLSRFFVCLNGGLVTWPLVLGGLAFDRPFCVSQVTQVLPACRRLLFPLLHAEKVPFPRATKEIGDVCTQENPSVTWLKWCKDSNGWNLGEQAK